MLHYRTSNHHSLAPRAASVTITGPIPFISSVFAVLTATMGVSVGVIVTARAVSALRILTATMVVSVGVIMTARAIWAVRIFTATMIVSVAVIVPARAVYAVRIIDVGIIDIASEPICLLIWLPPTDCIDA